MQYLYKPEERTGLRQAQIQRRRALSFVLAIPVATAFAVVPSHARQLYYQAERPYVESVQQRMVAHRARAAQLFSIAVVTTPSDAPVRVRANDYRVHYPVFDNQEAQRDAMHRARTSWTEVAAEAIAARTPPVKEYHRAHYPVFDNQEPQRDAQHCRRESWTEAGVQAIAAGGLEPPTLQYHRANYPIFDNQDAQRDAMLRAKWAWPGETVIPLIELTINFPLVTHSDATVTFACFCHDSSLDFPLPSYQGDVALSLKVKQGA